MKWKNQYQLFCKLLVLIFIVCLISGNTAAISIGQQDKNQENVQDEYDSKDICLPIYLLIDENVLRVYEWKNLTSGSLMPSSLINNNVTQSKKMTALGCMPILIPVIQLDFGSKHSETEYGWGLTGLLGGALKDEKNNVYLLGSYHRYSFGNGYDKFTQIGIQGRRDLGDETPFWVGAELGWAHDKSVYDNAEWDDPISNGFFAGGLVGYRLPIPNWDISAFAAVSFIHFGDFMSDNHLVQESHNSMQMKLGVELGLPGICKQE